MRPGSPFRRQTGVPATAVTAHVKHQPLQWNMGSVQRYFASNDIAVSPISPTACPHAPRWEYTTRLGRRSVHDVCLLEIVSSSSSSQLSTGSEEPPARKSS